MYRISQIKLNIDEEISALPGKIEKKIGKKDAFVKNFRVMKESLDARDKNDIKKVYTVDFTLASRTDPEREILIYEDAKKCISEAPSIDYEQAVAGGEPMMNRPVVVGFGPCGMFAALILAEQGYSPIVIERGNSVDIRSKDVKKFWDTGLLNPESNVQFGEGGAGTFSDGKLTTGIKDKRIRKILVEMVEAGADAEILYKQKPHIGTDVLKKVVANMRRKIIALGGEIRFSNKMIEITVEDSEDGKYSNELVQIAVTREGEEEIIKCNHLILAIGHSARDTFRHLRDAGVKMSPKPFSIGVRVEHPQDMIDKAQYGDVKGLPPAEYKLVHHCKNGRGVYTFCMCPGGEVICASSSEGSVVTNGMSNHSRNSGTANSGLLVDVKVEDFLGEDPLAGVEFQEKYERLAFVNGGSDYSIPETTWEQFREGTDAAKAVIESLPNFAVEGIREAIPEMGRKLKGFDAASTVMKAVETRSSSPVRLARDSDFQSNIKGLFPAGEGAGYAGGITSAACDGIKIAEYIIRNNRPKEG